MLKCKTSSEKEGDLKLGMEEREHQATDWKQKGKTLEVVQF